MFDPNAHIPRPNRTLILYGRVHDRGYQVGA